MLDDDDFPLRCPHCSGAFLASVGGLNTGKFPGCPHCEAPAVEPPAPLDWLLSEDGEPVLLQYLAQF